MSLYGNQVVIKQTVFLINLITNLGLGFLWGTLPSVHYLCSSLRFVCNVSIWHVIIKAWWAKFTVFSWLLKWRKASLEREQSLICWSSKFKSWSLRSGTSCQCLLYKKGYSSRREKYYSLRVYHTRDWPKYSGYHVICITATSVLYSV